MTGASGNIMRERLAGRIRAGIEKVRALTRYMGVLKGRLIPGTQYLTPAQSEAVEAALIRHFGIRPKGTLVNKQRQHNSSYSSIDEMLNDGIQILRSIGFPGI